MVEFKDYYAVLGVEPDAKEDEIKRAYRKLARTYHPDVSKEADAQQRFSEVGEAYEVLKDAEKRKAYDELRAGGFRQGQDFRPPPDWQQQWGFGDAGGFSDGDRDTGGFSDFFESIFGHPHARRGRGGQNGGGAFRMRGEDLHHVIPVSLEEAFAGGSRELALTVPEADQHGAIRQRRRTLRVRIPPGVTQGQHIRLRGQGGQGIGGGKAGDLYLEIDIEQHPHYEVNGRDVHLQLPVAPWEAMLGSKIRVPTLGGAVNVQVPAGSQDGDRLRLRGRGLPGEPPGDQHVILRVVVPTELNDRAKQLSEELAREAAFDPRAGLGV